MKDETIIQTSPVGKRLKKLGTKSMRCLLFNGKEIQMHSCLTIGRARENDFVIEDSMVSRYHLEIQQIRAVILSKTDAVETGHT